MSEDLLWKREVFPNGLRALLFPQPSTMTAQLVVAVEYGSNDDPKDETGLAHFLEHMLAGGSENRIELLKTIERFGGCMNFSTDNEFTISSVNVLPERLNEASSTLSELLFNDSFEKEKLEIERAVILNEIAEASDDPRTKVEEMLRECLYKTHPVKRPVPGPPTTVKRLTLNEIENAHQSWYNPKNMVLALTGKFSEGEVRTVLQNFTDRKNQKSLSTKILHVEEGKPTKQSKLKKPGLSQAYLAVGAKTISARHPNVPYLDLVNTILGVGESSRLFEEIREKRALTYDIGSFERGLDFGYFMVDCAVDPKHLKQTLSLIHKEIAKIKNDKVAESELSKAKNMILSGVFRGFDNPGQRAEMLALAEIRYKSNSALKDYVESIKSASTQNIIDVANDSLNEDDFSNSVITPETK